MADRKVSDELAKALDHLVGIPEEKKSEAKKVMDAVPAGSYDYCTWYGGCLYCENTAGEWYLVKCIG